jgi:hypothetical protein
MAIYYVNGLTGNDTNDGSIGQPWLTIERACQTAAPSDEVRVFGGKFNEVTEFTGNAVSSNILTCSSDPTGIISVGDVITVEHFQWGEDKFYYDVSAVTTTTISVRVGFIPTGTNLKIKKASVVFDDTVENLATANNVKFSGGWNSDYTLQDGWTIYRRNNSNLGTSNKFTNGGNLLEFDRFGFFNLNTAFSGTVTNKIILNNLISVNVITFVNRYVITDLVNKPTWYMHSTAFGTLQNNIDNVLTNVGYIPNVQLENQYTLKGANFVSGDIPRGINNIFMYVENAYMATLCAFTAGASFAPQNYIFPSSLYSSVDNLYIDPSRGNGGLMYYVSEGVIGSKINNSIQIIRNKSQRYSLEGFTDMYFNTPNQIIGVDNNREGILFFRVFEVSFNNRIKAFIKDIEGDKVFNGQLMFVDTTSFVTGNNSLRITPSLSETTQSLETLLIAGQYIMPNNPHNVAITMRSNTDNVLSRIRLRAGNYIFTSTNVITLNSAYQTFNVVVDNQDILNRLKDQLITVSFSNGNNSNNNTSHYNVDNVTITNL